MIYRFGDYELDTQLFELRSAGSPLPLEPKVFDLLTHLIRSRDRVVTKQELLTHLWPQQFVSDAALNYCIMAARKAVGDSGRGSGSSGRCMSAAIASSPPLRSASRTRWNVQGSWQMRCPWMPAPRRRRSTGP